MKVRAMYWDEDVLQIQNEVRRYEEELRNPQMYAEFADETYDAGDSGVDDGIGNGDEGLTQTDSANTEADDPNMKQGKE